MLSFITNTWTHFCKLVRCDVYDYIYSMEYIQ